MAARSWEADFRYPAILASVEVVRDENLDEIFQVPRSYCLPVSERPAMRWSPGKLMLVFLVLGFAGIVGGGFFAMMAEKEKANGNFFLLVGMACSLSGFAALILPVKCDRLILRSFLGRRGAEFYQQPGLSNFLCSELSKGDQSTIKIAIDADDHVLIGFDELNRRVLMEGIAARYQIRAEDVEWVVPFEWMNHVGVELSYRINEATSLRLAIARPSMMTELLRQAPILFFLRPMISNRIYQRFSEVLGSDISK